jgi:hypothetical protein
MFATGVGCCTLGEGVGSATARAGFAGTSLGIGGPVASRAFSFRSGLPLSRVEDSALAGGGLLTGISGARKTLGSTGPIGGDSSVELEVEASCGTPLAVSLSVLPEARFATVSGVGVGSAAVAEFRNSGDVRSSSLDCARRAGMGVELVSGCEEGAAANSPCWPGEIPITKGTHTAVCSTREITGFSVIEGKATVGWTIGGEGSVAVTEGTAGCGRDAPAGASVSCCDRGDWDGCT